MKIIDLHCDTLLKLKDPNHSFAENDGHISESGLKKGDYAAQCFAIYTSRMGDEAYENFNRQYDLFKTTVENSPVLSIAKNSKEITENIEKGLVSAILTVENASLLDGKTERISELRDKNVRLLGLIHNKENCLGYPNSFDKTADMLPLKPFGRQVVEMLNETNITVDVSHLNVGGFDDVAKLSKKPFVASHSGCRELFDHPRNLLDDQIRSIAESGGVVGAVFYSDFLNGTSQTKADDLIRHIEHLINIGGEDLPALGTDFDGMECEMFIENASEMQSLASILIDKFGFSVAEKICYKNALRIF